MKFDELGLSAEVLRAVADAGYETPTPIQEQAVPYVLMGRDLLGCAQTGTGKTASFTLPMIDILASGRAKARMPRSLIITPTRELATQISGNFETYGKYNSLTMALLIGGVSFTEQIAKLDRGVDVLIATPGRLLDHFERGRILLNDIKILVIDEADRMTDMGFMPDVERIVSLLPKMRQTLFFSATLPPSIQRIAGKFLMNPKQITVTPEVSTAETVSQHLIKVAGNPATKRDVLRRLIRSENVTNALVFCNRKRDVDTLLKSLRGHDFNAAALHGDMPQSIRQETLEAFRDDKITILVASDVAARGLDLPRVSHVFNFDVPTHAEDYVHRIGRTGRAGRKGHAFMIATPEESRYLAAVISFIKTDIPIMELEGIAAPSMDEEQAPRRSRGRGGRKSPTGRAKGRGRKPAPAATAAAEPETMPTKVETPTPAPKDKLVEVAPAAADTKPARKARKKSAEIPKAVPPEIPKAVPPKKGAIIGMGEHPPAFMLRTTRSS